MGWGEGEGAIFEPKTVFVKIPKKNFGGGGGGGGSVGGSVSGWGVRVDVNDELKFL